MQNSEKYNDTNLNVKYGSLNMTSSSYCLANQAITFVSWFHRGFLWFLWEKDDLGSQQQIRIRLCVTDVHFYYSVYHVDE